MFRRRRSAPPQQGGRPLSGVHGEVVPVADPDVPNEARRRALFFDTGLGMQGNSGVVVGYDRGDPANSFTAVVDTAPRNPLEANAAIGIRDQIVLNPHPSYTEVPVNDDVAMSNYLRSMKNRLRR